MNGSFNANGTGAVEVNSDSLGSSSESADTSDLIKDSNTEGFGVDVIDSSVNVPVLVDAGVGTASDAAEAMELGCDGVLMNTAIAEAKDPVKMARAMKHAVEAGRLAYLSGRMPKKMYADPSSPLAGLI